jgi:hypothetical protein
MLLEGTLCVTKQGKASKDTFLLIHLIFQINLSLKISHQKLKIVTQGGGVGKVPKKCHVLFEWPLTTRAAMSNLVVIRRLWQQAS